jgi:dsRNA-specific ribonuclease
LESLEVQGLAEIGICSVIMENYIGKVKEYCDKHRLPQPEYREIDVSGPPPQLPRFVAEAQFRGKVFKSKPCFKKKEARMEAAKLIDLDIQSTLRTPFKSQQQQQQLAPATPPKPSLSLPSVSMISPLVTPVTPPKQPSPSPSHDPSITPSKFKLYDPSAFGSPNGPISMLYELAQKNRAVLQEEYTGASMGGPFECFFIWNGVVLPKSRPFLSKKEAKTEAADLAISRLKQMYSSKLQRNRTTDVQGSEQPQPQQQIGEVVDLRVTPLMSRILKAIATPVAEPFSYINHLHQSLGGQAGIIKPPTYDEVINPQGSGFQYKVAYNGETLGTSDIHANKQEAKRVAAQRSVSNMIKMVKSIAASGSDVQQPFLAFEDAERWLQ